MINRLPGWVWIGGWLLAFIAGVINVVGLLGFERQAVTHLTGVTSMLGIAIATADYTKALHVLIAISTFFLGTVISGAIIQESTLKLGRRYSLVLFMESLLLVGAVPLLYRNLLAGVGLMGVAVGLQNAMATTYSGTVIRTSHVTGMFTDLGIFLGHALRGNPIELKRVYVSLIVISAFLCGGLFGTWSFQQFSYSTLYFPAFFIGVAALAYGMLIQYKRISSGQSRTYVFLFSKRTQNLKKQNLKEHS